jgi:ketosteroid isomerase-like protein
LNAAQLQARSEVEEIIHRETRAWDTQDVDLLLSVLHPDMVWPWPRDQRSVAPEDWVLELGRFDGPRWSQGWQEIFDRSTLVHNRRSIHKIVTSREGDGAFALVDIDTLWRREDGSEDHWHGRTCKVYSKVEGEWRMITQLGTYDPNPESR